MKATFNPDFKQKFTTSHRKEGKVYFTSFAGMVLVKNHEGKQELREIIDLRLYGTDTVWTCAIWIRGREIQASGTGSAGGGGYDKPSAAAGMAIKNAGFELSENIGGVGESAIERAMYAIAEAVGYSEILIHKAHQ